MTMLEKAKKTLFIKFNTIFLLKLILLQMPKNDPVKDCISEILNFIKKHGANKTSKFLLDSMKNVQEDMIYYEQLENKIFTLVCKHYKIAKEELIYSKRKSRNRKFALVCLIHLFQSKLNYFNNVIAEKINKNESLITQYTSFYNNIKVNTIFDYEKEILKCVLEVKEKLQD